jgi:hypothetical protein
MTTRQEWLLMALAHRGGIAMTPVQIQKAMFLMRMEAPGAVGDNFYRFVPYNYGPFDATIYHDLVALTDKGLVIGDSSSGRPWKVHNITPAGIESAVQARNSADLAGVAFLAKVVDWVCSLPFPLLVRAIYEKYPEFKANSVFAG